MVYLKEYTIIFEVLTCAGDLAEFLAANKVITVSYVMNANNNLLLTATIIIIILSIT